MDTNTTLTSSEDAESAIYLPGYLLRNVSTDLVQFTVFETNKLFKVCSGVNVLMLFILTVQDNYLNMLF